MRKFSANLFNGRIDFDRHEIVAQLGGSLLARLTSVIGADIWLIRQHANNCGGESGSFIQKLPAIGLDQVQHWNWNHVYEQPFTS